MSGCIKFSISLKPETFDKLANYCGDLIPRSRYIELILKKELSKKSSVVKE